MGNIKDLIVKIMVDDDEIEKFQKAGQKGFQFGQAVDKAAVVSAGALAALAGGAIAAGQAAAGAEQSQMGLQFALDQFPATADTNAAKLMELNSALALKTQYDDDAYASGQAVLAQFGLTGAQIEKLTPLLGDYAAKQGIDLPTAADQLGKALLGQGKALKSVGIDFADAGSVGANYDQIMSGLTSQVGGFAEMQGSTATGASAIFQNSVGELLEKLGQGLLPVMVDVTSKGLELMSWMTENSDVVMALASTIAIIAGGIVLLSAGLKVWAAIQAVQTVMQWANNAAWLASPVTWIILAIIVAIALLVAAAIWLYNNWDEVTKFIGEAFANVAAWFVSVGEGIAAWWNGLWSGIGSFFTDVWNNIVNFVMAIFIGYFNFLLGIGVAIVGWWNGLWSGISSFFASIWTGLGDIVKGAWNGIIGWIESGVNAAIDLINGIISGINNVGGSVGISLNLIPNLSIPRLATGGITMGPQLAMVGDNPGGRELILPLDSPAARNMLGGSDGPMDLSDSTIDKLARALAAIMRIQSRNGGVV